MVQNQNNNDYNFEFNRENQLSHMSYRKNKKNTTAKNKNEGIVLFVAAFFVMLLIFLGLAKQLSPDIDVSIGNEGEDSVEGFVRGNVDSRLEDIQNEDKTHDNAQKEDEEMFDNDLEEKVVIKKDSESKTDKESIMQEETTARKQTPQKNEEKAGNQQKQSASPSPQSTAAPAPVVYKTTARVIVGSYATAEQAEVAKGIIQEAGLNIAPIVRNIGGIYTIQTGAFSSREAAQNSAAQLLKNNFPARVIIEQ